MSNEESIKIKYTLGATKCTQTIKSKDYANVKAKLQRLGYIVEKIEK